MEKYIERLREEKKSLESELSDIAVFDTRTGDWIAKPEDHTTQADPNMTADVAEGWNERRALMVQIEMRWRNVILALKKVDEGTYGICEISGEQIEGERLDVNPAARTNKLNMERERELPL